MLWMVPFIRVDGAVGRVILAQYSPPRGVARRRPTQCGGMQAAGAGALNCKLGRIRYGVRARTPARVSIRGSWNDSRRQLDIGADTAVCRCRVVQYSTVQSSPPVVIPRQSSPVQYYSSVTFISFCETLDQYEYTVGFQQDWQCPCHKL